MRFNRVTDIERLQTTTSANFKYFNAALEQLNGSQPGNKVSIVTSSAFNVPMFGQQKVMSSAAFTGNTQSTTEKYNKVLLSDANAGTEGFYAEVRREGGRAWSSNTHIK